MRLSRRKKQAGRSDALATAVTRAPHSEMVCKASVPKPAAMDKNLLSRGVLTGDAGPAAASHIVTQL
jgi:hypothetical protein